VTEETASKKSKKTRVLKVIGLIVLVIGGMALWMFGPTLLPPKPVDAGIEVGIAAPVAMEIRGSGGAQTTLADEMGKNGMVLFLVRSADWCPFCKAQMVRTDEIRGAIEAKGYALAVLSYDAPDVLAGFAAQEGLGYTLLSDEGSRMIDALDLRDPQYEADSFAYGVPRASILVLGPDGVVKTKYIAKDYRSRPSNADVLAMVEGAQGPGQ